MDATETMTPPTGIPAVFTSLATELAAPVHVIVVPEPTVSKVKLPFDPGACNIPFTRINALFVAIVLKKNYLATEEYFFASIFWKLVFGKKFK